MQIIIKARQARITPQLRQRIERKMQRLSRLVDEDSRVEVTVSEEQTRSARDRFSVQIALSGAAFPVHSEVSALNASTALDLVIDKVVSQLGRHKGKHKELRHAAPVRRMVLDRSGRLSAVREADEEEEGEIVEGEEEMVEEQKNEAIWSKVVEIYRLPTSPMTDQEVIAHMEETGASFYPFYNQETQSVNVMYKLENGGYGLLMPTVE